MTQDIFIKQKQLIIYTKDTLCLAGQQFEGASFSSGVEMPIQSHHDLRRPQELIHKIFARVILLIARITGGWPTAPRRVHCDADHAVSHGNSVWGVL